MNRVGGFVFGYVVLVVLSLPYLIPPVPKSKLGRILVLLLAPPGYLLGEWLGGKFSESWEERTLLQKAIKAGCLIVVSLAFIIVVGLFRS